MKISPELPLRILTHNIRYATSSPFKGERPWPERKQLLINELLYNTRHQDTFICLQEVLHNQLVDILSGLNSATPSTTSPSPQPQPQPQHAHPHIPQNPLAPADETSDTDTWTYIGVGRDDGHQRGEYSAIFYRPDTWTVQHWETVWLSETPTKPSKSWDAASIRIVTIGVFRHRVSGQSVLAMSTHLDDQGARSRLEAAKIILRKIDEFLPPSSASSSTVYGDVNGYDISGVFLAGDFNSQDFQEAYVELTKKGSPLADAAKLVPPALHYGNTITWTGFGYEGQDPTRIDYVLLGGRKTGTGSSAVAKRPWKLEGYAVLPNKFDDGVYNSDHRAVVVDARLLSD